MTQKLFSGDEYCMVRNSLAHVMQLSIVMQLSTNLSSSFHVLKDQAITRCKNYSSVVEIVDLWDLP